MGCDIHIITEVKKEGKWAYVPEVPESLDTRNYNTFAFLASEVRNSFDTQGFAPRGLPKDISNKKFRFESETPWHHTMYEEKDDIYLLTPDGKYHKRYLDPVSDKTRKEIDEATYSRLKERDSSDIERYIDLGWSESRNVRTYYVKDASLVGGKWVRVPYNVVYPTFEEFETDHYDKDEEWDKDAQDYGYWKVDFDCCDYHTHSWLSLKDFMEKDFSDYTSHKYKMSRSFYEKFKEANGVLPECFSVKEESVVGDIADAFREAFSPTVLVAWQMTDEEKEKLPVFKGIEEMKAIAEKYEITNPEDIRIVFAFDN